MPGSSSELHKAPAPDTPVTDAVGTWYTLGTYSARLNRYTADL